MKIDISFFGNELQAMCGGRAFHGLGGVAIAGTPIRAGRLPLRPWSRSFDGLELAELRLIDTERDASGARLRLEARFRPVATQGMLDHSLDPIHHTGDWHDSDDAGHATGRLDLVLRPAEDTFGGYHFTGFKYHWEFKSDDVALHFLMDRASWELGGDIQGVTVISQSACSAPVVTFDRENGWSTEGLVPHDAELPNPVMTHNLPRWASHQAFDFQYRGDATLLGVFERVDLIRTVLQRDPGRAELKCFDKHLFDQTTRYATSPKQILLNTDAKSETDQRNLWTWVMDAVHGHARAEFGLVEEPALPRVAVDYWKNFTIDTYYEDLLPATIDIGAQQIFVDNLNKSDMSEGVNKQSGGNMCCGHEYEPAPSLGGSESLKRFVNACRAHDIQPMAWTNNTQSLASPMNAGQRDSDGWYVKMPDTRTKHGGAYTNVLSVLNLKNPEPRAYWVEAIKKIKRETGLDGYLFDSFYNLGFMPINYANARPTTMWRELLHAMKQLQDAGVHFLIESFGPFGQPQHGCPRSYSIDNCWVCYKIDLGNDYTTVPVGRTYRDPRADHGAAFYYTLAHMTVPAMPLFKDGVRVDRRFGDLHRQALRDYHAARPTMKRRFLQEDGKAVLWHDAADPAQATRATLWNFEDRAAALPGAVRDMTADTELERAEAYELRACHTYQITSDKLPTAMRAAEHTTTTPATSRS